MDIEFNETQRQLQTTARQFFEDHAPASVVRELEESEAGYSQELWQQVAGLDWLGLTYPESYGGSEGGLLDLLPIYYEIGRSLFPSPHLGSIIIAGETIAAAGSDEQKQRVLPAMAKGDLLVAPAIMEPSAEYGPAGVQLSAQSKGEGYVLQGTKILVPFAHVSDHLLVVARTSDSITLFLLNTEGPGITLEPVENIAGYPLFAITFEGAPADASSIVGIPGGGWDALSPVLDRATVLQCAEIVGAGERMMEMATEYAKERVQFGRPIGQNQAVQYLCSDVAIDMHLGSLLTRQAAWRIDAGLSHRAEVSMAKAFASRAAHHMARQAQEVFAGVGFMLEHDAQLYTRRAKHWEFNLGDTRCHLEGVAEALSL